MVITSKTATKKGVIMKDFDIDSQLRDMPAKPQRPLHRDFTKQTIERIDTAYYGSHRTYSLILLWRFFTMNLRTLTRPVVLASIVIGLTAAGGTAYAIVKGWPQTHSSFAGESPLQNGNKLYTVASSDCISATTTDNSKAADWASIKPAERLTKFEAVAGVAVDTKDLEQVALAICNEGASTKQKQTVIEAIAPQLKPGEGKRHYNDARLVVSSVDQGRISGKVQQLAYDEQSKKTITATFDRTYQVGAEAKVYDYDTIMPVTDLKVGDTIEVVLYSDDMPSYMLGLQSDSKEGRAKRQSGNQVGVSVVGIVKIPPFTSYFEAIQNLYNKYDNGVVVESIKIE